MSNTFLAMLYGGAANFTEFYLYLAVFMFIQYLYVGSFAYGTFTPPLRYQCTNPFTPVRL
jgi:hypothetical protein